MIPFSAATTRRHRDIVYARSCLLQVRIVAWRIGYEGFLLSNDSATCAGLSLWEDVKLERGGESVHGRIFVVTGEARGAH